MSFSNYSDLQTTIADWLNRTDLTGVIPDMIGLAEAEMKRRLRRTSVKTTLTISSDTVAIPAACAELRSMSLVTSSPSLDYPIRLCTPEMLAERRARNSAVTGRPTDMAVMGGSFIFSPAPDQTYTANIFYFSALSPLSASNTTNVVLTEAPDAYLYGSLLHAEGYLEHDERIATFQEKFDRAIDQLNNVRDREEHSASIRDVRLPRVFG